MADLTPAELVALADTLATEADRLSGAFALELADVLRRLERRLPAILSDAQRGGIAAAGRAAALGQLRANLRRLLTEAGYDDLIDTSLTVSLDRTLAVLAETSPAYRRALAFDAAGRPTALTGLLRAVVEAGRQDLLLHGDQMAVTVWRAAVRGMLGGDEPNRIVEQLASVLDGDRAKAATLYDTQVSVIQRVGVQTVVPTLDADVTNPTAVPPLAAGGDVLPVPDDQLYAYVGPVDGLIRPFCLEHVGRVYTKAEIDALDNGQMPNVFLSAGGFRCRHLWAPISRFSESADLHVTEQRLPEVEDALARRSKVAPKKRRRAA